MEQRNNKPIFKREKNKVNYGGVTLKDSEYKIYTIS